MEDVRATALDLITCAAYAEMMMTMVLRVGVPPEMASALATDLLSDAGRKGFGKDTTVSLLPAGSSRRREAFVLLDRGAQRGVLSPREAREMALRWLATAEATESDQLVSEALRATGTDDAGHEKVFGYLRELRSDKPAALTRQDIPEEPPEPRHRLADPREPPCDQGACCCRVLHGDEDQDDDDGGEPGDEAERGGTLPVSAHPPDGDDGQGGEDGGHALIVRAAQDHCKRCNLHS